MRRLICLAASAALGLAGCSNLIVHKVPLDQREAHTDEHICGFRYYLSRPYVAVMQSIPLTQTQVLVALNKDGTVTFLEGCDTGKTSRLEDLKKDQPSASVTPVSPAELARLQALVPQESGQGDIEPVQYKRGGNYSQNLIIADQGSGLADQDGGLLDAAPGGGSTGTPAPSGTTKPATTASTRKSAVLNGPIQIIFLPDMDEQYAVRSQNFVSKSDFSLQFKDGWQLTDVSGNHDSTPVALSLIQTIGAAIDAAKTLSTSATGLPGKGTPPKSQEPPPDRQQVNNLYILTKTTVLKPGLYRLNKPWEMGDGPMPTGCGLLVKLGLETFTTVELAPATKPADGTAVKPQAAFVSKAYAAATKTVTVLVGATSYTSDNMTLFVDAQNNPVAENDRPAKFKDGTPVNVTLKSGKITQVQLK